MWEGESRGSAVAVKVLRSSLSSELNEIRWVGHYPILSDSVHHDGDTDHNYAEILQGSHMVEKPPPSKRASIIGGDNGQRALRNDIAVDGVWEH